MQCHSLVTDEELNLLLDDTLADCYGHYKVLVVNQDRHLLNRIVQILGKEYFDVHFCKDPVLALNRCRKEDFDLVVSGFRLVGLDGVEMLTVVKQLLPNARRILLSEVTDKSTLLRSINSAKVDAFMEAPLHDDEFRALVTDILSIQQ